MNAARTNTGGEMTNLAKLLAGRGLSNDDAAMVAEYYKRERIAKVDNVSGSITFAHGAFLDADVLARAVKECKRLP